MRINLDAVFYCSKAFGAEMVKRRSGAILNLSSMAAIIDVHPQDLAPGVTLHSLGMIVLASGLYFHPEGSHVLAGYSTPDEAPGYDFDYDGNEFFESEIWPRLAERASSFERCGHVRGWAGLYDVTPDRSGIAGAVLTLHAPHRNGSCCTAAPNRMGRCPDGNGIRRRLAMRNIGNTSPQSSPLCHPTHSRAARRRRRWPVGGAKTHLPKMLKTASIRFTRLWQNWRNFKNAEVELSSRAFLVGPNAAGKSNLLDAFRFLRDVSIGGLAAAVDSRGGISSLRCVQATSNTDIGISVDMGSDTEPKLWSYALKFNRHKVLKEPAVVSEEVAAGGKLILKRPTDRDNSDAVLLTQTHLEQVQQNEKFREIANFFRSVRYLHVVPQFVRDARRAGNGTHHPDDGLARPFCRGCNSALGILFGLQVSAR
jgi:hypothetical protein